MSDPGDFRVLIYGMNYWPEFTSTGRYSGEIGAAVAAAGARVEAVTTPPHYPGWSVQPPFRRFSYSFDNSGGARIYRCPLALRKEMGGIWRLIAPLSFAVTSAPVVMWRLFRFRPHVILCIEPTLFAAPIAALTARLLGIRSVLHVQDLEIDAAFEMGHLRKLEFLRPAAGLFERVTRRMFDRVVTISNAMRAKLIEKGVEEPRLRVIRNWVDLSKIKPLEASHDYRRELDIPEEACVVGYAGSIGAKQALDVVLDAAVQLADDPNIVFIVAGDGPAKRSLVERYGQLPNVRFLDPQPEERLCELLNLPDLHVLPQMKEAADLVLPSKLGGMLASGRALIVTTDATQELGEFLHGAAIITPPGDAAALAEAIAEFSATRADPGVERRALLARELSSTDRLAEFLDVLAR